MFFPRLLCEPLFAQRLHVVRSVFATIQSVRSEIEQQLARSTPAAGGFWRSDLSGCSVRHGRSWDIALQRNLSVEPFLHG